MIKAISTYYKGNYFRSRLEARWAVFFEVSLIKYQYEPNGFVLPSGQRYLPDFYLPQFDVYAEVKPDISGIYEGYRYSDRKIYDHPDFNRWAEFAKEKPLILIIGNPHNYSIPLISGIKRGCVVNSVREEFWMDRVSPEELPDYDKPFIEPVGFYDDHDCWRLWRSGSGDEEFEQLSLSVEIANKARFEHGHQ